MAAPKKRSRSTGRPRQEGGLVEEPLLREIGDRIRNARVAAELSQESAAARAGIDYKRWQRLEQGAVNPTARTLLRVADAVDTTFWELLSPPARPSTNEWGAGRREPKGRRQKGRHPRRQG